MVPFLRVTKVSGKEILLSLSISMVKEMLASIEFYVSWKAGTLSFLMMQKLSCPLRHPEYGMLIGWFSYPTHDCKNEWDKHWVAEIHFMERVTLDTLRCLPQRGFTYRGSSPHV